MASESNRVTAERAYANDKAPKGRSTNRRHRRIVKTIAIVVITIVVVALIVWKLLYSVGQAPRSDRYQAVFLDNGQVFFGKLKNTHGTYLKLETAYYSKTQQLPENATAEQKTATARNISLVKVGDEVYGPENSLNIKAEQVLFWQNLTPDSKVAKAISSAN